MIIPSEEWLVCARCGVWDSSEKLSASESKVKDNFIRQENEVSVFEAPSKWKKQKKIERDWMIHKDQMLLKFGWRAALTKFGAFRQETAEEADSWGGRSLWWSAGETNERGSKRCGEFGGPLEIPARQASCPTAVSPQKVQKQKVNFHNSWCKSSHLRQTKLSSY